MIDPHVHLRDGIQSRKETILHGLSVASSVGIDWVFDMPNCVPPLTTKEAIEERLGKAEEAAKKIRQETGRSIRYSVYAGITSDTEQIQAVVALQKELFPSVVGLKMFAGNSTGDMGIITIEEQRRVYETLAKAGYKGVLAVHAEKEGLLKPELEKRGDDVSHSLARPKESEIASIQDQISLAKESCFLGNLHICHVSTVEGVELVACARKEGMRITCASTPHHLLLDEDSAKDVALHARMNPPLRSAEERMGLFQALLDGKIDWVETDHAPHTVEDKEKGASGIPGFSGLLLLLDRLYRSGVPEKRVRELFGGNVMRTYGLPTFSLTLPPKTDCRRLSSWAASCYPFDPFLKARS
jgi:dihydroorotase